MSYFPDISTAKGVEVKRDGEKVRVYRINPGCGKTSYPNCANVDVQESSEPRPDFVCDLNGKLPFDDDTFDSAYCSHTLEHLTNALGFMQELHRVCVNGAPAVFKVPYGSNDNAWEDPTHVRPYFLDSFGYFSQAAYGGADYGYKGDWAIVERALKIVAGHGLEDFKTHLEDLLSIVTTQRNIVEEMKVTLRCVKPIRIPGTFREQAPVMFDLPKPKALVDHDSGTPS